MKYLKSLRAAFALLLGLLFTTGEASADVHYPLEGFVVANGVRLEYLDWGGSGPVLILLHGRGDNPHAFDDLAPSFTDRFHVIAYARRGSGNSEWKGPYDVTTLTDDLRGVMDALGISKADLVGHSMGGDEITEMAAKHPERVNRIVYLDAAYDWADPAFRSAWEVKPFTVAGRPENATRSLDALRAYNKEMYWRELDDMGRIEADLRASVVIQPDGSVKDLIPKDVSDDMYKAFITNKPRDYIHVHCPALAIYAAHVYDPDAGDSERRAAAQAYDRDYWEPLQATSIERAKKEIANLEIIRVPGTHTGFILTDRAQVVSAMRRFLLKQ